MEIKLSSGKIIPIEMHKVRIVQKTTLPPVRERLRAIEEAGYNTFLLRTRDVFIDMLTDSGTNAMSDNQLAAMMVSDDAYAGGESYYKLLGGRQGRCWASSTACPPTRAAPPNTCWRRSSSSRATSCPMNYHFTTTKAHFELAGGKVLEIYTDEALKTASDHPFKGNMDLDKLRGGHAKKYGRERSPSSAWRPPRT